MVLEGGQCLMSEVPMYGVDVECPPRSKKRLSLMSVTFFFSFLLSSLELSDTNVYAP